MDLHGWPRSGRRPEGRPAWCVAQCGTSPWIWSNDPSTPTKVRICSSPIAVVLLLLVTSATKPRYGKNAFSPTRLATSTNWLRVVAEGRGHRDTAVLALGVAEVADGLAVVDRPELAMTEQLPG